mmetsp:Transcript_38477/g.96373  ORF Transcript_38477/g.96373 Transcript_38477/m.96373 type:complete len:241 (-) Transcript_38477:340-1062(-)
MWGQYLSTRSLERCVRFRHPLRSSRVREEHSGSMLQRASSVNLPHPPRSRARSAGIPRRCCPLSMALMGFRHPSVSLLQALRLRLCIPRHFLQTSATSMSNACAFPAMLRLVRLVQWSAMICTDTFVICRTSPTLSSRSDGPAPRTTACTPASVTLLQSSSRSPSSPLRRARCAHPSSVTVRHPVRSSSRSPGHRPARPLSASSPTSSQKERSREVSAGQLSNTTLMPSEVTLWQFLKLR